jgi:hypothetical protein
MNRRAVLLLAGMTVMGLSALPERGFSQSDPFLGIWQLNVAKSKYSPGRPPKSQTMYLWDDEGKIRKNSQVGINADGVPSAAVFIHIYDDIPRPAPGVRRDYDSGAYARVDAHTIKSRYLKAGNVLQTVVWTVSQDGKTLTYTVTGVDENGRQVNQVRIYEKQQ